MGQDNVVISGVHSTPLALQLQSASIALLCHHLCMKCCVFAFGYACQENFAAGGGAAEKEEEKKDEPEEESDEVCVVYLHQHQYSWQALMTLVAPFSKGTILPIPHHVWYSPASYAPLPDACLLRHPLHAANSTA